MPGMMDKQGTDSQEMLQELSPICKAVYLRFSDCVDLIAAGNVSQRLENVLHLWWWELIDTLAAVGLEMRVSPRPCKPSYC